MKLLTILISLLCLGFGQTGNYQLETAPKGSVIIATIELNDGTLYTQEILPSEVHQFEDKVKAEFGEDEFCCCTYQFEGGACARRRATCEESRIAFCGCVAEELEDVEISWCN